MCAEGFSSLITREVSPNNLKGFRINNHCLVISHLFFVDDSLIFCRENKRECGTIKEICKCYEEASGQKINLDKSMFMVSKNVPREETAIISELLGIKRTNSLGIYLEMPSQSNRNKSKLFDKHRVKIENLLQGRGKEILIKAVPQRAV